MRRRAVAIGAIVLCPALLPAEAHEITSQAAPDKPPAFDITRAGATTDGRLATFIMEVRGAAGSVKPEPTGELQGAKVEAYVWPTRLDPGTVGFAPKSGILALAVTAHPDFDDTPLFDENADGILDNDGADWHAHWVVLGEDEACAGGLKVRDISPGQDVLPATAPMLPIALDSPGMSPILDGSRVRLTVPVEGAEGVAFDAVTAELQVHPEEQGTPFLCVAGLHKTASGDLRYPGRVTRER